MQNDRKPSLKPVIGNHFLGCNLDGTFHLKRFYYWECSMFLYCGPSTVPIWSGTRIFYIVGRLVFLFGQEQTIFYIFYNWKHLLRENWLNSIWSGIFTYWSEWLCLVYQQCSMLCKVIFLTWKKPSRKICEESLQEQCHF